MSQRVAGDKWTNDELDASPARPVRMRRAKKRTTRSRKSRRKAATPAGIHQRANKRMNW